MRFKPASAHRLAEAQQRNREEAGADAGHGQPIAPDHVEARPPRLDDGLRQADEVSGRRAQHDVLYQRRHALARRDAARKQQQLDG